MEYAARSYAAAAAAAALAAGTVFAVTPALSPGLTIHAPQYALASADGDLASAADALTPLIGVIGPIFANPLDNLQANELTSNAALISGELSANSNLVDAQESFLTSIGAAFPEPPNSTADAAAAVVVTGSPEPAIVFERLLDANNLLLGADENLFNSVLGADNFSPATINASLLFGGAATTAPTPAADLAGPIGGGGIAGGAPFVSGQVGGIEGATGNDLAAVSYALDGSILPAIPTLGDDFIAFDNILIADELDFNTHLLDAELAAEAAAFGGNESALNGAIDRLINIDNLPLSTAENALNSLLGATGAAPAGPTVGPDVPSPAELTASLLTGTGSSPTDIVNVFDTGDLGGAEGLFDQNAALFADLAGLSSADITSAFAPGAFDPTAFTAALGDMFDYGAFSNLGPELSTIGADLSSIFTSLF